MFVRHPLTRLVSAFMDKFHEKRKYPELYRAYDAMAHKIFKHVGKMDPGSRMDISFVDFLDYIFSSSDDLNEEHWDTMEHLCNPCVIKYDFIGKLETFHQDSSYILSTVFKSNISLPVFGARTLTTDSVTRRRIANLPGRLRDKVIKHYTRDAKLFNYSMSYYKEGKFNGIKNY